MTSFTFAVIVALVLTASALASESIHARSHKHAQAAHHYGQNKRPADRNQNNFMKCGELQNSTVFQFTLGNGRHGTNEIPWNVEDIVKESDGRRALSTTKDGIQLHSFRFQECDSTVLNAKNSPNWVYGLVHLNSDPNFCLRASQPSSSTQTSIVLDKCDYHDSLSPQVRQMFVRRRLDNTFFHLLSAPMIRKSDGTVKQPSFTFASFNEEDLRLNRFDSRRRIMLKETHATSSGLKAFCTWATLEAIDKSRQACGGHGYSSYNGFATMYSDFAVHCTWEGDNTILALQSGRSLISSYQEAKSGKKLAGGTEYLNDLDAVLKAKAKDSDLDSLQGIQSGWDTVSAHAIKKAAEDFQACLDKGMSKEAANEVCSQVRFVAASIHTSGYIYRQFQSAIQRLQKGNSENDVKPADPAVVEHLTIVAKFYGLWQMEEKAAFFLRAGWLTPAQMDAVQAKVNEACAQVRKFAIPLIDAFALSDHIVNSPIGRADGNAYAEYFRLVRRNNPQNKEHPYFDRVIKPFIHREQVELEDLDEAIDLDNELQEIKEERETAEEEQKEKERENVAAQQGGSNGQRAESK